MAAVKVGVSRQVLIPKKIHDKLGLAPGDYLEVEVERGKVDKQLEKRLVEGRLHRSRARVRHIHAGRY